MINGFKNINRREFLKLGLFTLLSGCTTISNINSIDVKFENEPTKTETIAKTEPKRIVLKEGESPFLLWKKALIEDGVLVNKEFLSKYNLPNPRDSLNYKIQNEATCGYENFKECAIPENFNRGAFFTSFYTATFLEDLIRPERISKIFGLDKNDRLFKELENFGDYGLLEGILSYSLILTHKKLKTEGFVEGQTFSDFILHLNEGRGDCTDYCYGTANNFYAICDLLNRPDLNDKVSIVLGVEVDKNGKVISEHSWIEYGKKRQRLETTADKIDKDFEGNLEDYSLYTFSSENGMFLPLISFRFEDGIKYYTHCLPR
ncbi:hypothetical protein HY498_03585 [Candidatus Woesearchaeota archaeon]|nr:hypothetical protein [Candidatus Woesearchaeota archaeon]